MSGEKPLFQPQVQGGHEALRGALDQMGLHYEETSGKYREPERSYIIHNPTADQMKQLGKMFGQESVVFSQHGQHRLVYTNGEHEGKFHPAEMQKPVEHFEQPPSDFYTAVPGHGYMRINFDWNQTQSDSHDHQKSEREFDLETAAHLAKNAVAQLLRAQAPVKAHPHSYDWHDGHTDHHGQADLAGAQLPGLAKADPAHPHMDGPPQPDYNDQNAKAGVSTYHKFALPFGKIQQGTPSDLLHYKYHGKLPEIEKLVQDHGFKTYYAGGKYGKPDLANKNYNTGHLMVFDPSSANEFGHQEYTNGWRQIHELSHALVYPELNKIYGEGRRLGKLGVHRTLNEALRAVHWEWLAAHKQRELSKQVGVHLTDQEFNKELNTVMHDAAHRAVTGKFTEPSGEGFIPHGHHVPLHVSLQMVRDSAHEMGLKGMHETIKKSPMQKNLPLKSPAAAGVTRAPAAAQPAAPMGQPVDHVGNFMTQLKALRGDNVARGKHITQAMSNPDFIGALQQHPQGKSIHAMLTNHLNSTANAGPKAPMKVVAKSESSTNLSKAEGDIPVAEKTYTVEEAQAILLKATQEKVKTFAEEIKALKERELKKAIVPPHKHNQGSQASMAAEDIPPGKLNPKGVDKSLDKNAVMGYPAAPAATMAMSEEMCKTHKGQSMAKCGCKMEKADLVSENGKRTENHSVAGSKDPKPTKEIERGTKKDPGSGGVMAKHAFKGSMAKHAFQGIGQYTEPSCELCGVRHSQHVRDEQWTATAPGQANLGALPTAGAQQGMAEHAAPNPVKTARTIPTLSNRNKNVKPAGEHLKSEAKMAKNAAPPMAKPPSGKNMGTAVPTSAPKPPAMKAELQKDMGGFGKPVPQFASQAGHPSQPAGAGYGASGHQITQPIPKRKIGAGNAGSIGSMTPSDMLTQQDTVSRVKTPVMPGSGGRRPANTVSLPGAHLKRPEATVAMKSDPDMEKGVDKLVVHGDKPKAPIKGADFTATKQGDKAVYEAKKPELAKAAVPNQNAAALAGPPAGRGGPDLIPSDPAPKPAAKPQYMHPNHAALAAGAKPLTPAQPLASPKAAGATRAAGPLAAKPAAPAAAAPAPAVNAAKPAGAKPGIFGKLFGKSEQEGTKIPLPTGGAESAHKDAQEQMAAQTKAKK